VRESDADPIQSEFVRNADGRIVGAYWTLTCAWCGRSGKIDVRWYAPVSDPRHGISTLAGWEIGNRLVICPDCVEHDEWSRLWPPPSG
jgi:hypothetical protein